MGFKKIGVVVAYSDEFAPLESVLDNVKVINTPFQSAIEFKVLNTQVIAVLCGIGKVNAAMSAMYLIDCGCDLIMNFGLSGSLKGNRRGDFILPESFLEHDFDLTPLGYKPCEKPNQDYIYNADKKLLDLLCNLPYVKRSGTAVCGDRFINDSKSRSFLTDTFSAESCDMETAAIAGTCHITKTPFVALRRISDDASDNAAESYSQMNKGEGMTLCDVFISALKTICQEK